MSRTNKLHFIEAMLNWFASPSMDRELDVKFLSDTYDEITAPAWVSVEERLPKENGGLFLVCDKHDRVCESAYDVEDDIWYRQSGTVLYPTHWMPLPQPPVNKEGEQ
jgi:hypothetical protein